jgi:hypothetical protein
VDDVDCLRANPVMQSAGTKTRHRIEESHKTCRESSAVTERTKVYAGANAGAAAECACVGVVVLGDAVVV